MDISNLCRSCMKQVASWEKENFDARAVEMFCFCTNIKLLEDIKLPKQFCYDCTIKIESCYTFIKEAQNVNITLKNMASRSDTSIIIETESVKNCLSEPHRLRLTLPDYKVSVGVSSFIEQDIFDEAELTHNETRNSIKDTKFLPIETLVHGTQKNNSISLSNNLEKNSIVNINSSIKENTIKVRGNVTNLDVSTRDVTKKDHESKISKIEELKGDLNIDENKKFTCSICRKQFTSKKWYSKHMEKEHSGHKYNCAHCPKTFSKAFQLAYHAAAHSDERKFVCSACGKSFKRRKQLTEHSRGHSDVRPYACDQCGMRFKLKSVLKCHMKVHEDVKQYLCSYCGWGFSHAHNLEVHVRTHTGAKPHACAACGFRAAAASSLRRHARRHAGTRLHVCNQCRKAFHDKSGLARHVRTHTGELPYQCPGCARAFADSWKRKTHLMRAHRLALADIPRLRRDGQPLPPADSAVSHLSGIRSGFTSDQNQ